MSNSSFEEQVMQGVYVLGVNVISWHPRSKNWQDSCAMPNILPGSQVFQSSMISGCSSPRWGLSCSLCSMEEVALVLG